jgi:hypothetical protein
MNHEKATAMLSHESVLKEDVFAKFRASTTDNPARYLEAVMGASSQARAIL